MALSFIGVFPSDHVGLDKDRGHDQGDSEPERKIQLLQFTEENSCNCYAVDRFQVVGKVDRECWKLTEGLQLEEEGQNGEYGTEKE